MVETKAKKKKSVLYCSSSIGGKKEKTVMCLNTAEWLEMSVFSQL